MAAVCMTVVRGEGTLEGYQTFSIVSPVGWRVKVPYTLGGDRRLPRFRAGAFIGPNARGRCRVLCQLVTTHSVAEDEEKAVPLDSLLWVTADGSGIVGWPEMRARPRRR